MIIVFKTKKPCPRNPAQFDFRTVLGTGGPVKPLLHIYFDSEFPPLEGFLKVMSVLKSQKLLYILSNSITILKQPKQYSGIILDFLKIFI